MKIEEKYEEQIVSISPQIAPLPNSSDRRLIDNGMLHLEASLAGNAERYKRGETPHTIHVWWARRPHSSMRALTFASVCKDLSSNSQELITNLSVRANAKDLEIANNLLIKNYTDTPKVLDMFGGGGTIPFESSSLGLKTYSIDSNELSVFIQKCNLIHSQSIDFNKITSIVRESGNRIINHLKKDSAFLFPLRESEKPPIAYIWTYSMKCDQCNYKFYLSKRRWLSKKNSKNIALLLKDDKNEQFFEIGNTNQEKFENVWNGRTSSKLTCPNCGKLHENIKVSDCNDEIVALVVQKEKAGKEFVLPKDGSIPDLEIMDKFEQDLLNELNVVLPNSLLPKWSGIVNPAIYGIETHSDFINKRQRIMLLILIKALKIEYNNLLLSQNESTAKYVISLLSSFIDQLVDWNCRLSIWISENEQVGRAFCGPGVSMYWDYVEIDPVLNGPANLWSKLKRIISGMSSIKKFKHIPIVKHGYAQELPFEDGFFDAIVTDPPYYDNIYYSVLADFFYSWKRLALLTIDKELFSNEITDRSKELVASSKRSESTGQAHEDYINQFSKAIQEAGRVLKNDGVFSLVYSHSSINGWDAIVKSYRKAPLVITSVQPLSIERKQRPRAMTSEAVNTCIVFVARKTNEKKSERAIEDILGEIIYISNDFAQNLVKCGWNEEDIGLAVFANGVGMLSNISKVLGVENDIEALKVIANVVNSMFPSFKISNRKSL